MRLKRNEADDRYMELLDIYVSRWNENHTDKMQMINDDMAISENRKSLVVAKHVGFGVIITYYKEEKDEFFSINDI